MKLVLLLAAVVVMAMFGGEVATDAMEVGQAAKHNDARLVAAYGTGAGE